MTTTSAPPPPAVSSRTADLARASLNGGVYVLLVVVVLIGVLTTSQFRTSDNVVNILRSVSLVGVAALGMSFVVLVGSLVDLSIAATISVSAVVVLRLSGISTIVAVLAALAVATAIGAINGALIARFKANPILLTLATTTIAGGVLLLATNSRVTYAESDSLDGFLNQRVIGLPVTVIVLVVLTAACQLLLTRTTFGRRLLAVGGNERTAQFSGLAVGRIRLQAFALTGLLAGVTGVLLGGTLGSATPTAGAGYEFDALTAAVVGGCRLTGGRGSAVGVLAGAVLVGTLSNLLVLSGAPYSTQQVVKGVLLVSVVALAQLSGGNRAR
jgi:ribose/xylose/arabinose/galactoside ABC-type transport system permease subunit